MATIYMVVYSYPPPFRAFPHHILCDKFHHHPLVSLLIFPHLFHWSSNTAPHPRAALEVLRILSSNRHTHTVGPLPSQSPKAIVSEGLYPSPCIPGPLSLSWAIAHVPVLWDVGVCLPDCCRSRCLTCAIASPSPPPSSPFCLHLRSLSGWVEDAYLMLCAFASKLPFILFPHQLHFLLPHCGL